MASFKITNKRVATLEKMGEDEVFTLYADKGSVRKMMLSLFEPHGEGAKTVSATPFYKWLDREEGRRQRWKKYKELLGHMAAEEAVEISMEATQENWQVARLKSDMKKWQASILNREDYGAKEEKALESFGKGLMQALLEAQATQPENRLPPVSAENLPEADYRVLEDDETP